MPSWEPAKWGGPFWTVIHISALYFDVLYTRNPEDAKRRWAAFLAGITQAVPCGACESHFVKFQAHHPPPTSSRGFDDPQFLKWTVNAHNKVRERTHKSVPKVDDVVRAYVDGRVYRSPDDPYDPITLSNSTAPHYAIYYARWWKIAFAIACTLLVAMVVGVAVMRARRRRDRP
jgi:apolipoprotein N-acyltransferase